MEDRMVKNKCVIFIKQNLPTILTIVSSIGVVGTAIAVGCGTPKALQAIEKAREEKNDGLSKLEVVKSAAPAYIPAFLIGGSTIACIISANILNKRVQASLMSAYTLLDSMYRNYQEHVKDVVDEDTYNAIRNAIIQENYKREELSDDVPDGSRLFYDELSDRYFEMPLIEVLDAELQLNREFALGGCVELNRFYELLSKDTTEEGRLKGWSWRSSGEFYGHDWIDIEYQLIELEDGLQCYVIHFITQPTTDFNS